MRSRVLASVATAALVLAACGGGDSGGPQTEQGALDAVKKSQEAVFKGNADDVLDFLNAECRESVDEDEVKLVLGLATAFLGDEVDLDASEVETSIEEYTPQYLLPILKSKSTVKQSFPSRLPALSSHQSQMLLQYKNYLMQARCAFLQWEKGKTI